MVQTLQKLGDLETLPPCLGSTLKPQGIGLGRGWKGERIEQARVRGQDLEKQSLLVLASDTFPALIVLMPKAHTHVCSFFVLVLPERRRNLLSAQTATCSLLFPAIR